MVEAINKRNRAHLYSELGCSSARSAQILYRRKKEVSSDHGRLRPMGLMDPSLCTHRINLTCAATAFTKGRDSERSTSAMIYPLRPGYEANLDVIYSKGEEERHRHIISSQRVNTLLDYTHAKLPFIMISLPSPTGRKWGAFFSHPASRSWNFTNEPW